MTSGMRITSFVLLAALCLVAAWRIIVTSSADLLAPEEPSRALQRETDNPAALRVLAETRLAAGQWQAAAASARQLLAREPLQGEAFVVLAAALRGAGDLAGADAMNEIALRRAPMDPRPRAVAIDARLAAGDYAAAMHEIATLLRVAPSLGTDLTPALVRLADIPAFADALARSLAQGPSWRAGLLSTLLAKGSPAAITRTFSSLQDAGGLTVEEAGRWIDRLIAAGQWGEAYSRWAGTLALAPGASLAAVHDGGFESVPTGIGFDWRLRNAPGVIISRVSAPGARGGMAAELAFSERRVPVIPFEQYLLLAPGEYRLQFRARARHLRSDQGLEWAIGCQGAAVPLATAPRLEGNFDWQAFAVDFVVPASDCPAQRLWLQNPGTEGSGKIVSGTLWFDDIAIQPAASHQVLREASLELRAGGRTLVTWTPSRSR